MLSPHCPFTQVPQLAASRTSIRSLAYLAQRPRKRSRKPTTRSAPSQLLIVLRQTAVAVVDTVFFVPSDGQEVSPWHQQRRSTSQGEICSAGRSLRGLVSVFIDTSTVYFPAISLELQIFAMCLSQVLSDEGKRKQYDTYGSTGFDAGQASGGQHYWSGQTSNVDPEELFRKIFGEFSGGRGFGDFNAIFDQPQEVSVS